MTAFEPQEFVFHSNHVNKLSLAEIGHRTVSGHWTLHPLQEERQAPHFTSKLQ
jgi:hypothetical protein